MGSTLSVVRKKYTGQSSEHLQWKVNKPICWLKLQWGPGAKQLKWENSRESRGTVLQNESYGIVIDWNPKGSFIRNCTSQKGSSKCEEIRSPAYQNFTELVTYQQYPLIFYEVGMVPPK